MTGGGRIQLEGLWTGLEAPSGVEPLHRSFADCSLNHLGTAPRAHYSGPCSDISTYTLEGIMNGRGRCLIIGWVTQEFLFRGSRADPTADRSVSIPRSNGPRPPHSPRHLFPWPSARLLESAYPSTLLSAPFGRAYPSCRACLCLRR